MIPLYWRLKKSKYNLVGNKCTTCNNVFFPPRSVCSECRRKGVLEDFKFSGVGKILSYTIIRNPPEGFEDSGPYAVAIIELAEGAKISGQITGSIDDVSEEKRVEAVFRKIQSDGNEGIIRYGLKWKIV